MIPMANKEIDAPIGFWGPPHRAATTIIFICVTLGLMGYLLFLFDAFSGGYGPHVAFPPIRDHDSLRMTLSRAECLGPCPAYSIEIRGDGLVIYEGKWCVAERGHHDGHISESRVDELFEKFREAEFLSLKDSYFAFVTDQPTIEISLRYDGVSKTVTDYAGQRAGMPTAVTLLQNAIDETSGTEFWVWGGDRHCGGYGTPVN